MKTLLESAKKNISSNLIRDLAKYEGATPGFLLRGIHAGKIIVPLNLRHKIKKPCAIGYGLRTKVNANLGTSTDKSQIKDELDKLNVAINSGADTVMDLSVGGDLTKIRRQILENSSLPVGTVPIYEIAVRAQREKKDFLDFNFDDILEVLENQAKDGIDFFTIHAGITKHSLTMLKNNPRLLGIVSRGGAILASWMSRYKKENPFYEYFDSVLKIAKRYDITLSLGDALRPGSILDATDRAQLAELRILGKLSLEARKKGVQTMIEGPGHIPINQIEKNVRLEKKICHQAPFYVLGPLVTDVAVGYDHITSAIGGAIAASYGADFLCYVTASEHIRHPGLEDVREGVVAAKIAAHAADIAKGIPSALLWDKNISGVRKRRNWKAQIKLAIDPEKAERYRASSKPEMSDVCTMCGKYCSIKLTEECLRW